MKTEINLSMQFLNKYESASMKMADFWIVAPCSLVEVYWRFRIALMMEQQASLKRS
jgi:hypothetical protein